MKVRAKAPWVDRAGLHKKGDLVEIETAAFNPILMEKVETAEKVVVKKKTTKKATKKG